MSTSRPLKAGANIRVRVLIVVAAVVPVDAVVIALCAVGRAGGVQSVWVEGVGGRGRRGAGCGASVERSGTARPAELRQNTFRHNFKYCLVTLTSHPLSRQ